MRPKARGYPRTSRSDGDAILSFPVEVDLANADDVDTEVRRLLAAPVSSLVIDLSECHFCDSSGIDVLIRANARARALDIPLRIVLPAAGVVRAACEVTGVTRLIEVAAPPPAPEPPTPEPP